jgi:hypothetical protein
MDPAPPTHQQEFLLARVARPLRLPFTRYHKHGLSTTYANPRVFFRVLLPPHFFSRATVSLFFKIKFLLAFTRLFYTFELMCWLSSTVFLCSLSSFNERLTSLQVLNYLWSLLNSKTPLKKQGSIEPYTLYIFCCTISARNFIQKICFNCFSLYIQQFS